MSLDTYSNLKVSVANWLHRTDLTSLMDDFIALGEEMIWKDLRVSEMEDNDAITLSSSSRYANLPTGTLEVKRAYLNTTPIHHLKPVSTTQIDQSYNPTTGRPQLYAVLGNQLEFERTPDDAYDLYVHYFKKLAGLSGTNSTNDILTYYPSIYLYAVCLAGAIYAEDDDLTAKYTNLYTNSVSMANAQTMKRRFGAGIAVRAV
jgi:hypothetical protein